MARVVVVGSVNVDLVVAAERLPARGETVIGRSATQGLGGKGANQAVAAARAGAETLLVARVGRDDAGDGALASLVASGVDVRRVRRAEASTGTATVIVSADGSNMIVVVPAANLELSADDVRGAIGLGDLLVAQLEIASDTVRAALHEARAVGAISVLNASPVTDDADELAGLADLVVVNEGELAALGGERFAHGRDVLVTLGARGAELRSAAGGRLQIGAPVVEASDTTGAGDCFLGVTAAWLCSGADLPAAAGAGCAAASLQVTRAGAASAMPHRDEILFLL